MSLSATHFSSRTPDMCGYTFTKPHVHNSVVRCMSDSKNIKRRIVSCIAHNCVIHRGFSCENFRSPRAYANHSQYMHKQNQGPSRVVRCKSNSDSIRRHVESYTVSYCSIRGAFTVLNFGSRRAHVYRSQCVCQQNEVSPAREKVQRA